jgi:hypothetical protein
MIWNDIAEEVGFRKITRSAGKQAQFFDWKEYSSGNLIATGSKFDSLSFRCYKAVKRLGISFHI